MTSAGADSGGPHQLLAVDLAAVGSLATEDPGFTRLGDRLTAIRQQTLLVYIGGRHLTGLPDPDYTLSEDGRTILRMPHGDALDGWPADSDPVTIEDGVLHVAGALFVMPSEVFIVAGRDLSVDGGPTRKIIIGGDSAPPDGIWVRERTEGALIEALEDSLVFGRATPSAPDICDMAYEAAVEILHNNVSHLGFTAASIKDNVFDTHDANYAAVWARDGIITGLWSLCLNDVALVDAFRATLRILAKYQSPAGQIPSNVRLEGEEPDYSGIGGIASIDSVLWYVIGVVRFVFHTNDRALADELAHSVERAMAWLAALDANNDGLIEIPESSDWMDLFPRSYNVLYDEVLWFQACADTAVFLEALGQDGEGWREQADRVRQKIVSMFWPTGAQLMEITGSRTGHFQLGEAYYLLSQVTPFDYGWRCDVYANLLAALSGLLDDSKRERLFTFLWGVGVNTPYPVACLYPPIPSGADDWKDYFLVNFLNLPDHYHNGGIWPFIGGLWVRFLAGIGRVELAYRELTGLAEACRQGIKGEWEFNEWLHGGTGRPMGKAQQAWSAASYVHAYYTLHYNEPADVFPALDAASLD